jgi:hypothetical protein
MKGALGTAGDEGRIGLVGEEGAPWAGAALGAPLVYNGPLGG